MSARSGRNSTSSRWPICSSRLIRPSSWPRFALHILGLCGVYDDGFAPNALVMANLSGMRKVGLKIINLLEASDKDAYIKLIAENLISKEASNG